METNLHEIEEWILKALNLFSDSYFNQANRSGEFVTYNIKEIIGNYGHSKGFDVCACGFPGHFDSEWMYDLVWYNEDETKKLKSVELVLESEQTYGIPAIKFDFEKLLIANTKYRIMICLAGMTSIEEIKSYCSKAVNCYTQLSKGERVFTLIWDDFGSGDFIPHLVIKD
jgi:hypothetical protein